MESFKIFFGYSKPNIPFTIENDPPSIYFNFKIREQRVAEFAQMLEIPAGFTLNKIRCMMDEVQEHYYLTLNVYRVSGLTNGLRAEWSTYVKDPEGKTRYMIVEARSNRPSMDPIDIITKKSYLEYSVKNNQLSIYIASDNDTFLKMEGENIESQTIIFPAKEWIRANDAIYWLNGISDRTYHNCSMACSELFLIPPERIQIENTTKWKDFIEPNPGIIRFPAAIEMLVSPWWNI